MIILVRHGETEGNRQRVMQLPDVPLNARGRLQAERVAERLTGHAVAQVVSSDLARARTTAEVIAAALGVPLELDASLVERNFGALRGVPYTDLTVDPFAPGYAPPEGEAWDAFHARVERAFAGVVERRRALTGPLVVVTHGLVCRAMVQRQLAYDGPPLPARFGNTSVTFFDAEPPHVARLVDCTRHLPPVLRTDASFKPGAV